MIQEEGLTFKINDDFTASIVNSVNIEGKIIIPKSIFSNSKEYLVNGINKKAFSNNRKPFSIDFPQNTQIKYIDKGAFSCSGIKSIFIPETIEDLKEGWCKKASNLTNITISPKNEHFIYYNNEILLGKTEPKSEKFDILLYCKYDVEKVVIPSYVKYIGCYSFLSCYKLKTVDFGEDSELISIGKYAFANTPIERISFPNKLQKIGKRAFCFDFGLKISNSNDEFVNDLFDEFFCKSHLNYIYIPKSVKYISNEAFKNCSKLKKFDLENEDSQLQVIGDFAFSQTSIDFFSIPKNVQNIGQFCFLNSKIRNVIFSKDFKINYFGMAIFSGSSLEQIMIPSNLLEICERCFSNCSCLKKVEFPVDAKLQKICKYAFDCCSIRSIMIPKYANEIEMRSFFSCSQLRSIEFLSDHKYKLLGVFEDCYKLTIISFPFSNEIKFHIDRTIYAYYNPELIILIMANANLKD